MFNIGYSLLPIRKLEGLHCHSLLSSGITQNITAIEWCNHCSCSTRFIFPSVSNWRLCSNRLLFFFSAMWLWNVAHGYRVHCQILQVNTRWKALAEIYTMHSFAPLWNPLAKNGEKRAWPKQPRKGRKREAIKQRAASRSLISIFFVKNRQKTIRD